MTLAQYSALLLFEPRHSITLTVNAPLVRSGLHENLSMLGHQGLHREREKNTLLGQV